MGYLLRDFARQLRFALLKGDLAGIKLRIARCALEYELYDIYPVT